MRKRSKAMGSKAMGSNVVIWAFLALVEESSKILNGTLRHETFFEVIIYRSCYHFLIPGIHEVSLI